MVFFEKVQLAAEDPILGIAIAFQKEARPQKINLGIGSYKTSELKPYVLESVKEAEKKILEQNLNKEYLPIDGEQIFLPHIKELIFGDNGPHIMAAQTVGGTGALRVGADFLRLQGFRHIFLPSPTWDNHNRIFQQAGFSISTYAYYNAEAKSFDFQSMMASLEKMPQNSVILLQACCHNPTGFDPSLDEWRAIAQLLQKKGILPYFDFAYQGFGKGIQEDAAAIRSFAKLRMELLVAASYSKNFGLYAERCGALCVLCGTEKEAKSVMSQIKMVIRGIYSNPPCHGARIVATILGTPHLRDIWTREVSDMRARIAEMRKALIHSLERHDPHSFEFMKKQIGMFSYTGLHEKAVEKLIADYAIYMTKDGRINVAGLNSKNVGTVADAIIEVMK